MINPLDWFRWLRAWLRILWVDLVTRWQIRVVRQMREADEESLSVAQDAINKYRIDAEIRRSPSGLHCEGCRAQHSALVFTNPSNSKHAKEFLCSVCFLDSLLIECDQEIALQKT